MVDSIITVKGLPAGWTVKKHYTCGCGHDKDGVILCERTVDDGDHGTRYVVWWVNGVEGGCYNGDYTNDLEIAERTFERRKSRLR